MRVVGGTFSPDQRDPAGSMARRIWHCAVADAWAGKTGRRSEGDLLGRAASETRMTSRLPRRIKMKPGRDGLVVHLPESQL